MNRLFAVKPLLVVTAALAIALVLACGGRGETTSPGSLLRLLPQNADSFTFADLEQLRDERLDNLEQQLASLIGEGRLDDWEIDLDDASSLVLSDPNNDDALIILRGRFVAEDVEDALDDDGLRDSAHRDVTVWSERSGGVALAFVGEDVIVIGGEERVEDSIDVFIDEARSMEQDDEAEAIVDALEDALVYSVAEDCSYRDCRRQGSAVRVEAGDLVAVFAFLFRNDNAAADAEGDIEDDLEELVDDPRTEADGEMVIAESPVDEDQLGLDRNGALAYRLEGDGSTPGRGGEERPTPTTERPRFADDHGDDRSGATRIRDGEFLDGDIERDGDRDFFSFSAEGGGEYRIETHLGSNSDTVLVLYGPDGDYLDEDDDSGEDAASRLEWVAPSSDTYYIEVSGFDGTLGTYQLSLFELGPAAQPEPTEATAQAFAIIATPSSSPTLSPALTAEAGSSRLSRVRNRGSLICASRNDVPGFGFLDASGINVGFDIDLCRAVATAVLGDPNAIEIRLITAAERGPTIQSGEVDLLVRTVTWTASRDAQWGNFVQTMFYDGQGFMVRKNSGVTRALQLRDATVCVTQGTTTELNLQDFSTQYNLDIRPLTFEDTDAVSAAYQAGQCDAFTNDRSQLAVIGSGFDDPSVHTILPETISEEPTGPVVPHGDDQWFDIVKTVMAILIYGEAYGISQGSVPSTATGTTVVDRLLGTEGSFEQESLGLSKAVGQTVLRDVGNYGEIYARNLGPGGINLPREGSRNALWADAPCRDCPKGGQIYAAPLR